MEIKINKKSLYVTKAGDVLSLHNAYTGKTKTYLVVSKDFGKLYGVVSLDSAYLVEKDFDTTDELINYLLSVGNYTEEHIFKSEDINLELNVK